VGNAGWDSEWESGGVPASSFSGFPSFFLPLPSFGFPMLAIDSTVGGLWLPRVGTEGLSH